MTRTTSLCLIVTTLLPVVLPFVSSDIRGQDQPTQPLSPEAARFEKEVAPLLARRCASCHAADDAKGKLDLTTRDTLLKGGDSGTALVPGDSAKSLIWQRIVADEMPPKRPLPENEKALLKDWIATGAVWSGRPLDPLAVSSEHRAGRDWWSLQPLKRVVIPEARSGERGTRSDDKGKEHPNKVSSTPHSALPAPRSPVDSFVQAKLLDQGLTSSPDADRRTLIRRVSFDLIGLPPTPEEVDAFVNDPAPDAYERLIDRLLASPHFGERWARHWLDVVRFGESHGFERDLPRPNAWHFRDWVIDALNRDTPYDEFVRWQLAGDLLAPDDINARKATGFLVAGAHDTVVPVVDRMRAMMRQDEMEDIIAVVSQSFLGLTVNCARCHDHKFDPISAKEYYQLAAALAGVDHGEFDFVPAAVSRELNELQSKIDATSTLLREQDVLMRDAILKERAAAEAADNKNKDEKADANKDDPNSKGRSFKGPTPLAAWDFTRDLRDQIGEMHVTLHSDAKRRDDGLFLDGNSYASTTPLKKPLREKTLEAKVRLLHTNQRGGGVISLQTTDGHTFDAIVFGENEPFRWMAGSNGFVRTLPFGGDEDRQADKEFAVIAIVYKADGTIIGYRNGQPYGKGIRKSDLISYEANTSHVLFGMRHGTSIGGNRMLAGIVAAARLYDKALSPEEVASSASFVGSFVTEAEIVARLSPADREVRLVRQTDLNQWRKRHGELKQKGPTKIYTAIATQPSPSKIFKRGNVAEPGETVAPAGLSAIQGLDANFGLKPDALEHERRLALANWITSQRNPTFARVMVNRLWHHHFGSGLVDTPNDFGFNGSRPSHPELLEWLAGDFAGNVFSVQFSVFSKDKAEDGTSRSVGQPTLTEHRTLNTEHSKTGSHPTTPSAWSIKKLHRLLVTTSTYRQASTFNDSAAQVDAGNRLLWRMNPRRLEAESVRDAMLAVAGQLNNELGGKGYSDTNSYFFKGTQFYDPVDPTGFPNQRRTIYRMWARGGRSPFLDTFDCPDPSTTTPKRSSTVTPLQALSLMNHSFVLRMADQFAERLKNESSSPLAPALRGEGPGVRGLPNRADEDFAIKAQVILAYRHLYGRTPEADEVSLSTDFIKRRSLPAFCRAMWNSSEFLFVD